jgi:hypothetical protein
MCSLTQSARRRAGFIAIFSPAFPLAPLLAVLNNVMEIRVDSVSTGDAPCRWRSRFAMS